MIASRRGDDDVAARLHGSLTPLMTEVLVGLSAKPAAAYQERVAAARERLGPEAFDRLATEGSLLRPSESVAVAAAYVGGLDAAEPPKPAAAKPPPLTGVDPWPTPLTPRELEILRELTTGATNRQIGSRLGLTPKTVMHHSVSIYSKLGVRSRTEATAWALRQRMLD
jgi:DNA-binding NarL/FixJ family response regulator